MNEYMISVKSKRNWGDWKDDVFYFRESNGLFGNFTVILFELCNYLGTIKDIDCSDIMAFKLYRDDNSNLDIFKTLIKPFDNNIITDVNLKNIFTNIGDYNKFDKLYNNFDIWVPWIKKYFTPSNVVTDRVNLLIKKYKIDLNNTVAIHYRGTDKVNEIPNLNPVSMHIEKCKEILNTDNNLRVLIQSDQQTKTLELFKSLGNKCFYFRELPQSPTAYMGVHYDLTHPNRVEYAINFLASIIIISKCKYVITHRGGGAFWTALYRGNMNNFYYY